MTSVLVFNLGRYDYGLWEMVMAIVGYMGILDLGIRPTVSRFAAGYIARDDQTELSTLYATAFVYLFGVGVLLASVLALWGLFYPQLLAEDSADTQRYSLLLLILAAQLLLVFPAYTAESFMEAYQEYYLKNNVTILNSVIGSIILYNFITPANALVLLAAINAAGIGIKYLFYIFYMQYRRRFLRISPARFSRRKLKELFTFGVKTLIQGISTRIENATDTLVIGIILGPATVPFYSIPANLVNYIRLLTQNLTHVFMPYFSALSATGKREKTIYVYLFGSKLTVGAVLIMAIGAVALGEPFLRLWIGEEIAASAGPIIVLLVAFTILPLLNPYSSRYLTAIDRHAVFAKWSPVAALANLALSIILIYPLGIYGVALGSLLPALILQPYILWYCCRQLDISLHHYLQAVIYPLAIPTFLMIAGLLIARQWYPIDSYRELLAIAISTSLLFCLAGYITALSPAERLELRGILKRD
jgi:O-antigen/teichoic acid export membrane protein